MNPNRDNLLNDQAAIVTGAGQGVGAAIAQLLAANGAKVAVNDINPDRAERVAAAIRAAGGAARAVMADVSNKFQCSHLIDTTRREWGQLDILINNAAIKPGSSILKTDEFEWQRVMDVNLKGTFFMSQLAGRVMADENQGRGGVIINIASTAGVTEPLAGYAAYAASKAGVVGFTRECAREFAAYNLRVHALVADELTEAADIATAVVSICVDTGAAVITAVSSPQTRNQPHKTT
jgi:NAD(P)-dependent dehydrogenase (short-subunit alcohol dehydrogenase family)